MEVKSIKALVAETKSQEEAVDVELETEEPPTKEQMYRCGRGIL